MSAAEARIHTQRIPHFASRSFASAFDEGISQADSKIVMAGCVVNEWWAVSGNAFEDFPVPAPGTTRRSEDGPTVARGNMDLQAQQVCQRPIDMRKYFSNNDVPQMPTTTVAC